MSALRHLVRLSRIGHVGGTTTRGFAKRAKKDAAPVAAGAKAKHATADDNAADHSAEPAAESSSATEPGTAGAAAEDAAAAARAAAAGFGTWAKQAGSRAAEAGERARLGASARVPPTATGMFGNVVDAFREEYRLAMMDPGDAAVERRKQQPGYVAPGPVDEYTGTTAVAAVTQKESVFQKAWGKFARKTGATSLVDKLNKLRDSSAYKKGTDFANDLQERWETSDSPLVHKIQDMQDGMFTETEQAEAYKTIRQRDPGFNINDLLAEVRRDVPKVLGAYLKGDLELLKQTNTTKEMLERMGGQMAAWRAESAFVDPRILHMSEMELVEVRMMEGEPLVVCQFSCQQINCVRNKLGEVVDGAEDDIQAVHYLWAVQLSPKQFVAPDGREYKAQTWQLREMVLRGMMSISM